MLSGKSWNWKASVLPSGLPDLSLQGLTIWKPPERSKIWRAWQVKKGLVKLFVLVMKWHCSSDGRNRWPWCRGDHLQHRKCGERWTFVVIVQNVSHSAVKEWGHVLHLVSDVFRGIMHYNIYFLEQLYAWCWFLMWICNNFKFYI